jgi:hypothetical protein
MLRFFLDIFAEQIGGKFGNFDSKYFYVHILHQIINITMVFKKIAKFLLRKLFKIVENWSQSPNIGKKRRKFVTIAEKCELNIDPTHPPHQDVRFPAQRRPLAHGRAAVERLLELQPGQRQRRGRQVVVVAAANPYVEEVDT